MVLLPSNDSAIGLSQQGNQARSIGGAVKKDTIYYLKKIVEYLKNGDVHRMVAAGTWGMRIKKNNA
eukprot:scaffold23975_cov132-Cylindrotheca_fusiformis.AAC.3